jgi:alpha-beta hydrolase superfamily lysophospholipase
MFWEAEKAAKEVLETRMIDVPVLLVHGTDDELTSFCSTKFFFDRLQAPWKTLKIYPGLRHELHNETARSQIFTDYLNWMNDVLAARNQPT